MYSDQAPPSLSSTAIGSFDQEQIRVGAANVDPQTFGGQNNQLRSIDNPLAGPPIQATGDIYGQPPSQTAVGHGQENWYNQLQDGTVNRGLGQTAGLSDGSQGPSFTAFGQGQGNSQNQFQDGNRNRGLGEADGYDDGGQAPSVGAMARGQVSQPSNGGGPNRDDQAPSYNDVARRAASQPGQSAGNQNLDPQDFVGMSLVGRNFRKFHPNAYYKGKDEN